jgi:predicted ABC-type ATPase
LNNPKLWIIAGCNGAGKSSYSKALVENGVNPFDYDAYFLKFYQNLQPSDIQDRMAHNLAFKELERQIESATSKKMDFAYETNFNSTPLFWPQSFKDKGYEIHLIYLVLDSIKEAKRRVAVRVQNGGHFVSENEIHRRYLQGFQNFDNNFTFFDIIDVFDCSAYESEPKFCFSILKGKVNYLKEFPEFLKKLVPNIFNTAIRK